MAEYEAPLMPYLNFVLMLVDTQEKRCRSFLKRLNRSIRDPLEPLRITNYVDLVDRAFSREMHVNESRKRQEQRKKPGRRGGSQTKGSNNN